MSRRSRTPETPIAKRIRAAAATYAANGQKDRAEGMMQAADMVDVLVNKPLDEGAELVVNLKCDGDPPASTYVFGQNLDEIRARISKLEAVVFQDAKSRGNGASLRRIANGLLDTPPKFEPRGSKTEPRSPMDVKMLAVLAQRAPASTTLAQLAILTGYSRSGSFSGAIARLRKVGWIAGTGDGLVITDAGYPHAPDVDPIPKGDALLEFWCKRVGTMGGALLQTIVAAYPEELDAEELAERNGYKKSGSFSGALAVLRALDLITPRGIRASEELMRGMGR